jgi:hypothetical protein
MYATCGAMDNARSLFEKLDLAYIENEMIGKEFENNWLECKEKDRPDQGLFDKGDKANFARALSGFANSSGGVLIFGLEARKDKDDIDQIIALKPIKELRKFESALREHESRIVERIVTGVEYRCLPTGDDEGLLAVYVPESERPPHRSQVDSKFYIRAGGVFSSMPVTIIEDLFARRQRPALELSIRENSNHEFIVSLMNRGKTSAKHPYVVLGLGSEFSPTGFELNGNTRLESWVTILEYKGMKGRFVAFQAGHSLVVHPDSEVALLALRYAPGERELRGRVTLTWSFNYYVYAENMLPVESKFVIKREIY